MVYLLQMQITSNKQTSVRIPPSRQLELREKWLLSWNPKEEGFIQFDVPEIFAASGHTVTIRSTSVLNAAAYFQRGNSWQEHGQKGMDDIVHTAAAD